MKIDGRTLVENSWSKSVHLLFFVANANSHLQIVCTSSLVNFSQGTSMQLTFFSSGLLAIWISNCFLPFTPAGKLSPSSAILEEMSADNNNIVSEIQILQMKRNWPVIKLTCPSLPWVLWPSERNELQSYGQPDSVLNSRQDSSSFLIRLEVEMMMIKSGNQSAEHCHSIETKTGVIRYTIFTIARWKGFRCIVRLQFLLIRI